MGRQINGRRDYIGRETKITMKEALYVKIHGNSDNDYPHGNKHKAGNN